MLKAGDFIQCHDVDEMVQYSTDLENMGIWTDFASGKRLIIVGPWLDPEVELPAEDGVFRFALVNGKAKDGATCEEAPAVVEYWQEGE